MSRFVSMYQIDNNLLTKTTLENESINNNEKNEVEYTIPQKFVSGFDSIALK